MTGNQEILLIFIIDSILPNIKALNYQGWSLKLIFFHVLPGLARLGYPGHHFSRQVSYQKIRSRRVACAGLSSSCPPILKPFRRWSSKKNQALASISKLALPFPRLVPHRVKTTSSREISFFDPFPTLSKVRISLVATFFPHTLD